MPTAMASTASIIRLHLDRVVAVPALHQSGLLNRFEQLRIVGLAVWIWGSAGTETWRWTSVAFLARFRVDRSTCATAVSRCQRVATKEWRR